MASKKQDKKKKTPALPMAFTPIGSQFKLTPQLPKAKTVNIVDQAAKQSNAEIAKQKVNYANARAQGDYAGMRVANTLANKARASQGALPYSSAKGDTQFKGNLPRALPKANTARISNYVNTGIAAPQLPNAPIKNTVIKNVASGLLAPLPALKTVGSGAITAMYGNLPTGAENVRNKIAQTAYGKAMYGVAEGLSPISTKPYMQNALNTDITNSLAFKAGDIAGTGAGFVLPYAGAEKAVGQGLLKVAPRLANAPKLGQTVAKSVATDIAVGLPLNINYAYNKEGLRGKEALKDIGINTAIDLVSGGILEAAPIVLKSGKRIASKTQFDKLPTAERTEVLETVSKAQNQAVQPQNVNAAANLPQVENVTPNLLYNPNKIQGNLPKASEVQTDSKIPVKAENPEIEQKYKEFESGFDMEEPMGNTGIGDWVKDIKSKGVGIGKDITRNADTALKCEGRKWFKKNFEDNFYNSKGEYAKNVQNKVDTLYNEVVKKRGIRKGTKESAGVQWFGEGQKMLGNETKPYTLADLQDEFNYKMPNGKYAWENIVETDKIMRGMYDDYVNKINESLKKIYPNAEKNVADMERRKNNKILSGASDEEIKQLDAEIDRYITGKRLFPRKDYYHHFQELQNGFFSQLDNIINSATNIDPKLVGTSEFTRPKSKFMGALQHRSKYTDYKADALEGMLQYIPQAEYKINIEPNIPVLRNIIKDLKDYTSGNANQFIDYLMKFTNDLAGKTNTIDRAVLNVLGDENGRKILNGLGTVSNRVRANAVVGNLNTVLAQFFNMPNVVGYAKNPVDIANGMVNALKANLGNKESKAILEKSDFLRERYLDRSMRKFDTGVLNDLNKFFSWTMELGDKAVADSAFTTFYNQGIKKGLPETEAIRFADDLTRKSVAGRGIGELPLEQKSKVVKLFAPFQVEVRNAYNVLKEKASQKDIGAILGIFGTTFLMNTALEASTGRRIGFDPIDVLMGSYEESKGKTTGQNIKDTAFRLGGEALTNMPFGSYIGEGVTNALGLDEYQKQQLFGESDPTRFGTGNIAIQTLTNPIGQAIQGKNIDLLKPALAVLPKFGGKQIERTVRGLQDMAVLPKETVNISNGITAQKQDFPASYSNSGNLRFAIKPSAENYIKAPTLGTWSTDEGKNYIGNKLKPLGEKQTNFVKDANKKGLPAAKGEEIIRSFKGLSPNKQREKILELPINKKQKQVVGNFVDNKLKEPRDYSSQENYDFSLLPKETRQKFLLAKNTDKSTFTKSYLAQKDIENTVDKAYAILEVGNEETAKAFGISQKSIDSAKAIKNAGLNNFSEYKKSADTDGNNSIKKDEAISMLESTKLTKEQKRALFKALCPNVKSNPY